MTTPAERRARTSLAVQLYRYGLPVDDIALVIGVTRWTVYRYVADAGLDLRHRSRLGDHSAARLYRFGFSVEDVADITGRDVYAVRTSLAATGTAMRRGRPASHRISTRRRQVIPALYRSGVETADIAERFACSPYTVRAVLASAGVPLRRRPARRTAVDLDALARLNAEGRTDVEIAAALGVSAPVVGARRRALGLPAAAVGGRGNRRGPDDDEIRRLAAEGWSPRRIADQLGRSYNGVTKRLRAMGIAPPAHPRPPTDTSRDDDIRRLYAEGCHDPAIAAALGDGWDRNRVAGARRRLNLPGLPQTRRRATEDEVRRLHAAGLVDREIGELLGRPTESIKVVRQRLGLSGHRFRSPTQIAAVQRRLPDLVRS